MLLSPSTRPRLTLFSVTVRRDTLPVAVEHRGELLIGRDPLPLEALCPRIISSIGPLDGGDEMDAYSQDYGTGCLCALERGDSPTAIAHRFEAVVSG